METAVKPAERKRVKHHPVASGAVQTVPVRIAIRDSEVSNLYPADYTIAAVVDDLKLPNDLNLVVVDYDFRNPQPLGSNTRVRGGMHLFFTALVHVTITDEKGQEPLEEVDVPILGLRFLHVPRAIQTATGLTTVSTVVVDGTKVSGSEALSKAGVVEHYQTILQPDP